MSNSQKEVVKEKAGLKYDYSGKGSCKYKTSGSEVSEETRKVTDSYSSSCFQNPNFVRVSNNQGLPVKLGSSPAAGDQS